MNSMSFAISFNSDANMTMVMNSADSLNSQRQTDEFKKAINMLKAQMDASGGMLDRLRTEGSRQDDARWSYDQRQWQDRDRQDDFARQDRFGWSGSRSSLYADAGADGRRAEEEGGNSSSGSSASPVGITDYPGAVINAGNNAQNRINNLGDQHNAKLVGSDAGGCRSAHGASNGTPDPAEMDASIDSRLAVELLQVGPPIQGP